VLKDRQDDKADRHTDRQTQYTSRKHTLHLHSCRKGSVYACVPLQVYFYFCRSAHPFFLPSVNLSLFSVLLSAFLSYACVRVTPSVIQSECKTPTSRSNKKGCFHNTKRLFFLQYQKKSKEKRKTRKKKKKAFLSAIQEKTSILNDKTSRGEDGKKMQKEGMKIEGVDRNDDLLHECKSNQQAVCLSVWPSSSLHLTFLYLHLGCLLYMICFFC